MLSELCRILFKLNFSGHFLLIFSGIVRLPRLLVFDFYQSFIGHNEKLYMASTTWSSYQKRQSSYYDMFIVTPEHPNDLFQVQIWPMYSHLCPYEDM